MTEKRTNHIFWAIVTAICFFLSSGALAIIPAICWLCAANNTRKHNLIVAKRRHEETIAAIHASKS